MFYKSLARPIGVAQSAAILIIVLIADAVIVNTVVCALMSCRFCIDLSALDHLGLQEMYHYFSLMRFHWPRR